MSISKTSDILHVSDAAIRRVLKLLTYEGPVLLWVNDKVVLGRNLMTGMPFLFADDATVANIKSGKRSSGIRSVSVEQSRLRTRFTSRKTTRRGARSSKQTGNRD